MTFRARKDRGPPAGSEEQQIWQSVRNYLKSIENLEDLQAQELASVELRRKKYLETQDSDAGGGQSSKDDLSSLYQQLDKQYEDEQRDIAKALEKLEVLIAVRDDSNSETILKRKKRKVDGASSSPPLMVSSLKDGNVSPDASRDDVPAITQTSTPHEKEKKRANSKSNTIAGSANTSAPQRRATLSNIKESPNAAGTNASQSGSGSGVAKDSSKDTSGTTSGSGYVDPARARREVLADQLPLQKGRKVAFRQPSKNKVGPGAANVSNMTSRSASTAAAAAAAAATSSTTGSQSAANVLPDDEGETWIMATIIECINNDRNRYVVQDAEDTAMPTYNTTLKAIVPLPESLLTLPMDDYKVGTQVMGLYPDTSCFYQAIVRGGGPGLNGKKTAKMQRKQDELLNTAYRLEFEDDGGAIQNVPACLVVERP